jgi:hypothetical protein
VQVGSLVDSADCANEKNAVYKYRDKTCMAEMGDCPVTRNTLVQTIQHVQAGEPILVFYGAEYNQTAMPEKD